MNSATTLQATATDALTTDERDRLGRLEAVIEKNIIGFRHAGAALSQIRDDRLYREKWPTFDAYVKGQWGFGASRARQLIGAAQTAQEVESVTQVTLTEKAMRQLNGLDPDQQREVVAKAIETHGEAPSAPQIAEVRAEVIGDKPQHKRASYAADRILLYAAVEQIRNELRGMIVGHSAVDLDRVHTIASVAIAKIDMGKDRY